MPEGDAGVKVVDLRDREFLLVLDDVVSDHEGWASSWDMADRLSARHRNVAQRLSHMVRFGLCEREVKRDEHGNIRVNRKGIPQYAQRWRLTERGHNFAFGKLSAGQRNALEAAVSAGDNAVAVAEIIGDRYTDADPELASLLRRQWTWATAPERRRNGGRPGAR